MTDDARTAREVLEREGVSLALCREGDVITDVGPGIRPLLGLIDSGTDVCGYSAADRVVGKAAALLYVLLGVREVYARTMSEAGRQALVAHGIVARYGELVPQILNRARDGLCPMERAVAGIDDPAEALPALREAVLELMGRKRGQSQ